MRKIIVFLLVLIVSKIDALAQGCAMCAKTASNLSSSAASGLNTGILYLAFIPLLFMSTIGIIWWRHNRKRM
jgi:hypothetical protein